MKQFSYSKLVFEKIYSALGNNIKLIHYKVMSLSEVKRTKPLSKIYVFLCA